MNTRPTQTDWIKDELQHHARLTQQDADTAGIKRLGARIWELRHWKKYEAFRRRYRVKTTMIKVKSRWGSARVAEYRAVRR